MAVPLLALGKIVSGVVTGTAKGLTIAGKATAKGAKVVGRAARAGGELALDTASAAKKGFIKGVRATTKGLQKAASSTRKSMSNFGKRMSKRKTSGGIEKLKRNSEKIRNNINRDIKKLKKQRLDRERIQRNVLERGEVRKMEKNIESAKTPTGKKVNSILRSPMNIIDKIFGLGSILLTGIIVNSIEDIIEKWKEFKKNNQGIFDFLGKIIKGIGDFLGDVKISKLEKEGLKMDEFAVFNEEGDLIGGKLLTVKKTMEGLGTMIGIVHSLLPKESSREPFDPDSTIIKEEIDPRTGQIKKLTANQYNKKTYYIDQNGIVRFKENDIPALLWNKMATEEDKKILDKKDFNDIKGINNNNNNLLQSFNTVDNTTVILAYQKEIEYEYIPFPTGTESFGGALNYDQFQKLPSIWNT